MRMLGDSNQPSAYTCMGLIGQKLHSTALQDLADWTVQDFWKWQ